MPALLPVPPGSIAAVVTHLEMVKRPEFDPPGQTAFTLAKIEQPDLSWYRNLYRSIGEEWLWFSRLMMTDEQLAENIWHPNVAVYALRLHGEDIGLLELDWRQAPECEIAFFGVSETAIGTGAGSWLMRMAQRIAFDEEQTTRLWLHTCTLDHPNALPFYLKHGFKAFRREVEIVPDPRLSGNVRRDAASFHPIIPAS